MIGIIFGISIIGWAVARMIGGLPRWLAPRPLRWWLGPAEVVLGLGLLVFAVGGPLYASDWGLLTVVIVFLGVNAIAAFRGIRHARELKESEEDRLKAYLREDEG